MAQLGWLGIVIPEAYGGEGRSCTDAAVLFEELGRGPVPGPYFSSGVLGALTVLHGGTEAQKHAILPRVATGEQVLSLAVTEPHYGWRPETVQMRASLHRGSYTLHGVKLFVHDAQAATHLVCAVRTSPHGNGASSGITLLVVDAKTPGVTIRTLPGWMSQVDEVHFTNVQVPATAVLGGTEGQGWETLEAAVLQAIPILCAYQVGSCQTVFDMAVAYSRTRVQFGQPIGKFQSVANRIVDMKLRYETARLMIYKVGWLMQQNKSADMDAAMTKLYVSESFVKSCLDAIQIHGGSGFMTELEFERELRDSVGSTLYSGTSEIQRNIIARGLRI